MAKYVIESAEGSPPAGAYSQGWRAGDFIFVTGTGPIGPDGGIVGDTIEEQTQRTIDNIETILRADGASLEHVIKVSVHLSDVSAFAQYNEAYMTRFKKPYPVRTTVGSTLPMAGMMVEIDCVAYVGD